MRTFAVVIATLLCVFFSAPAPCSAGTLPADLKKRMDAVDNAQEELRVLDALAMKKFARVRAVVVGEGPTDLLKFTLDDFSTADINRMKAFVAYQDTLNACSRLAMKKAERLPKEQFDGFRKWLDKATAFRITFPPDFGDILAIAWKRVSERPKLYTPSGSPPSALAIPANFVSISPEPPLG